MTDKHFDEKYLSQFPAVQLLINLGYQYISPSETKAQRQGKTSEVLLENILRSQLKEINHIRHKGRQYLFSEENIQSAIQKLKRYKFSGLLNTNEAIYDLLTLGTAREQTVDSDTRSFTMNYIDWNHAEKNVYHVTLEFPVKKSKSNQPLYPDIVLFVNGIPFTVIECKSPEIKLEQAISQQIRNQNLDNIPQLFVYSQMLIAIKRSEAQYATTGSSAKFWSIWREEYTAKENQELLAMVSTPIKSDWLKSIMNTLDMKEVPNQQERLLTQQDKMLYSLCRPERMLDLVFNFIVFDNGEKKIARYQQYFVVKSTMRRVKQLDHQGRRKGGMIWHTQGSGKSLTMVMIARALALDSDIVNPRIILVSDRIDLDDQLNNTFAACGLDPNKATSGKNLMKLITEKNAGIISTVIHKFDNALKLKKTADNSDNIFLLVDESHRSQFGIFGAKMRQMFPRGSYIGFTGTPLMKKEKNNFLKFGKLIEPHYSIRQAVKDKAVVPLLYEGRLVEMDQNKKAIDLWFERHTKYLTEEQRVDLKKKYSRAEMLNKADQVIFMRAFDISEHYQNNWQGSGFKAQLVAPDRNTAVGYKKYLDELALVSSEIIVSPPDMRESYEEINEEPSDELIKYWQKMMQLYGDEEQYNTQIINKFKNSEEPEILIVVSKLLTGFNAPRNTVLYICKTMVEHTLLQAIARVNRVHEGKEFGFIVDYIGLLGELDQAITMYSALDGFDQEDIEGTIRALKSEIDKLEQRHSALWDLFKSIKNKNDEEEYELLLANDLIRKAFYEKYTIFTKTLKIALSSESFLNNTSVEKITMYQQDDLFFKKLRKAVKIRYAEAIDYKEYELRIKKLLDTQISANDVQQLNKPVNIFDENSFDQVKESQGIYQQNQTKASQADTIAHATKKIITEKMDLDPAFYEKFSNLIQKTIDDFRNHRISDLEYLKKSKDYYDKVVNKKYDNIPGEIENNEDTIALYGVIKQIIRDYSLTDSQLKNIAVDISIFVEKIISANMKVNFWEDDDAQKTVIDQIDDYLFDEIKDKQGLDLSLKDIDRIIKRSMTLIYNRRMANE